MLPKVTILMAMYKPNLKWLEEQLISLNNQEYANLELLVWNDCPSESDHEEVFKKYITRFSFKIIKGEKNLGSNGAFENLTKLASSEYVAYCDQDDIWQPEKIKTLIEYNEVRNCDLLCSDMLIIDEYSNLIANSITEVFPHFRFYKGNNQFQYLLNKNFVVGCTTLVKTTLAKKAVPFPKEYVHDWWLAIYAAAYGTIGIVNKHLIKYRRHSNNQTDAMNNVMDKESYYKNKILEAAKRSKVINTRFRYEKLQVDIKENSRFILARLAYHNDLSLKNFYKLFQLRKCNLLITYFELCLPFMPDFFFDFLVKNIKKGRI